MPRSSGKGGRAGRRGSRTTRQRSWPWLPLVLVGLAGLAVFGLTQLDRPAPTPPTEAIPGIEVPDASVGGGDRAAPDRREPVAPRAEGPAPSRVADATPLAREGADGVLASAAPAVAAILPPKPVTSGGARPPRVAIVLDDCGQNLELMRRAVRVRQALTFAVIPHLPASRASAEAAHAAGHEVIVHQPMEPESPDENPGAGAIRRGMSPASIRRILTDSFADVPHARGMNNHMGSGATADARLMSDVLGTLARLSPREPAYFLDSRTTPRTVAEDAARSAGLKAARRNVFLDNDLAAGALRTEFERLLAVAAAEGSAIGIGHLKPETLAFLEVAMPAAEGRDARFVFLGDLVR